MGDNQHVVARLESFSDIVIGFSLAQAAVNLVVTDSVESFLTHPFGIFAYLITFFFVARTWWMHSQIMHRYFEPNPLMIGLNFIALAALGLMIFSLQLWMHRSHDLVGQILALKFYFVCFAITTGTMAVMRALGVRFRWPHLSVEQRRSGMGQAIGTLVVVVPMAAGVLVPSGTSFFGFEVAPMPANLLYAMFFGGIAARIVRIATARSRWGESDGQVAHA